jgi:two-component system LytT family response regulator
VSRSLTALIVDDERLARAELRTLLAAHAEVAVVGEAADIAQAAELVERLQPDVVFLDIQMRGESGFDLFDRAEVGGRVIFVTAHDAHALRAFQVNALDYLLKPVEPARLAASLERLRAAPGDDSVPPSASRRLAIGDFLFLPLDGRPRFLRLSHIVAVEAAGDSTELTLADLRRARAPRTLKSWEERLPESHFVRIHRETIINLQYVDRIEEWSHEAYHVHLRGLAQPLTLSRRFASRLKVRFA